jgi:hypothetical protein
VTRVLAAAIDISREFPDILRIAFQRRIEEKTIKATVGRAVLTAGCALNRWGGQRG